MLVLMRLTVLAVLLFLLAPAAPGMAQQLARTSFHAADYFSLDDLARNLGTVTGQLGGSTVLRTGFGILTLFTDTGEWLWSAEGSAGSAEGRLALPPVQSGGTLWVPLELLDILGATVSGVVVVLPDRTRLLLTEPAQPGAVAAPPPASAPLAASELIELGNGVNALRLNHGSQSLLITDLGLLSLVQPAERSSFDQFMQELSGYRPLYFVLSAATAGTYSAEFTVRQGSLERELSSGAGVVLLRGDTETVAPGRPVSGLILLPETTNLRAPLQVQWQHLSAAMIFRR